MNSTAGPWLGPENALAARVAEALARGGTARGDGPSPLLLHGPPGVGKSRLLAEIVAERLRVAPGAAVAHLNAEAFGAACLAASRGGRANHAEGEGGVEGEDEGEGTGRGGAHEDWPALRAHWRGVELFVLDDVDGLWRVPAARDELAHTLDALESTGAAVALAARVAPAFWPRRDWPARLVNRLMGGLVVGMAPPGLGTRRRYLLRRSAESGLLLASETVERLALAADGFRTIDGWLARLALENRARGAPARSGQPTTASSGVAAPRPIGLELLESALGDDPLLASGPVDATARAAAIAVIARAVAARFGVRLRDLRGPDRHAALAEPRHLAMYLARARAGASVAAIGAYFGQRDRATVRHACRAAAARIDERPDLASALEEIARAFAQHRD